ncbi:MAG: amino acid ABC transporter permease, partial [Spirochaetaceae bacterium]|nr:amino acid ABC transporter permease [Spirochaetaceae bacterium]
MAPLDKQGGTRIDVTDGALLPTRGDGRIIDSWRITIAFAILALLTLLFIAKDPYSQIFKVVVKGAPLTFGVTAGAILGSIILGLFTGLGQIARGRVFNLIAG